MAEIIVAAALNALCSALATTIVNSTIKCISHQLSLVSKVREQMQDIENDFKRIQSLLTYADQIMEMNDDQVLGNWVKDVRDVAYKVEDIVESHMYGLAKRGRFDSKKCRNFKTSRKTAFELEKIKPSVKTIVDTYNRVIHEKLLPYRKGEEGSSSSTESRPQKFSPTEYRNEDLDDGLFSLDKKGEQQKKLLEGWILQQLPWISSADNNNASFHPKDMFIVIWGMRGLGKTTLLEQIFHRNISLRKEFDCLAWITVSKTYRRVDLLRELLKKLAGSNREVDTHNNGEEEEVVEMIRNKICQRRYLIVFDDVWQDDFWSNIRILFSSSDDRRNRILFSTRHENVLKDVRKDRVMQLSHLNPEQAWSLFCKKAFRQENPPFTCPDKLVAVGKRIVGKCGGLPLAIVTVAGMGYTEKRSVLDWENSCRMLSMELGCKPELSIFMHSYFDLSACLKQCFLHCCCTFSEDLTFHEYYIIALWLGEGFIEENDGRTLEEMGKAYLEELVRRSMMIQEFHGDSAYPKYKIHDTLRAVGLDISKRQKFGVIVDEDHENCPHDTRRLSIYKSMDENIPELPKLRTLYVRKMDELIKYCSFRNFKLLKVLDLEGVQMLDINIPREIFKLFNLRHLNLRNTGKKEDVFPSEIDRLRNLLFLDISETGVKRLPRNIGKLRKLRTLLCGDESRRIGIQVPAEIFDLKDLQCLRYIEASGGDVVEQLGNLTQLRVLGITKVKKRSHEKDLCRSLNRMAHLKELDIITAEDEEDSIDLESLNHTQHPRRLERVVLIGAIKGISTWCKSLQSLRYLSVVLNYKLEVIVGGGALLFDSLKSLPHLEYVALGNAFQGTKLSFPSLGFPNLREMIIALSDNLTSIEMEDSAPPKLRWIEIYSCPKLIPPKDDLLERLEEIRMGDMPPQVVQHFQEMCTRNNVKLKLLNDDRVDSRVKAYLRIYNR